MKPSQPAPRRPSAVFISLALHAAILGLAVVPGVLYETKTVPAVHFIRIAELQKAGGSHALRLELPRMPTAATTRKPTKDTETTNKTILPVKQPPIKKTGGGAPPAPHAGNGAGQALAGNGDDNNDATPAFPIVSPRPPVSDRSLLPTSEQKIVVDVNVDIAGAVVGETLVKGMGTRLDQIVMETVKQWRFQPAKVNGKPVPTEAELVFPFTPSYPISGS